MTVPKTSDIIGIINKMAPFGYAEGWDNVGLQVGDPTWPAGKIMIALDPGADAVAAAVEAGCRLLLTHHPLIFHPLKKVSLADPAGRTIAHALKNDLAVVSLHTNYDVAEGGMNDVLARSLGLEAVLPLKVTGADDLAKLVAFIPVGHEEKVLEALFRFSGFMGNYSDCSFSSVGSGTFKPFAGARPFIGRIGKRERVEEVRAEVLLRRADISAAVTALIKAHPYEEPAFDIYPVMNQGKARGLGRIGKLTAPVTLKALAESVKERLGVTGIRVVGDEERLVRSVAVCGGSGASLLRDALFHGADVLVTGDIKYHEAREAEALGVALIDAGHFGTERVMVQDLAEKLVREVAKRKFTAEILPFHGERDPFTHI